MVLNRDMGSIVRLPSLQELPAAGLSSLPAPQAPLVVADLRHQAGLPDARTQHALLCLAAAPGGLSLVMSVSLQHIRVALQLQTPHASQLWEVGGECPAVAAGGGPGAHPCCGAGGRGTGGGS